MTELSLAFGLRFADLYERDGLVRLDAAFLEGLPQPLAERLRAARQAPENLPAAGESQLLLEVAPHLDGFTARLFGIEKDVEALKETHDDLAPLWECRKHFVLRRAAKAMSPDAAAAQDGTAMQAALAKAFGGEFTEMAYARHVMAWLADEAANKDAIDLAARYAAWVIYSHEGHKLHAHGVLFEYQKKLDFAELVPCETIHENGMALRRLPEKQWRVREGFNLTDTGCDIAGALSETKYCLLCWKNGRDSCSKGFYAPKTGELMKSPLGAPLDGCPLGQKISEMNELKAQGFSIGALGVICIDNPMAAGTGHRICNACMKSCIFQKVDPVNIPEIETRTLKDVLGLPWGFEIYSLMTRWNPLNIRRPLPRPDSGYKVLVVGLGPAGYALSHHLINDGHAVAAVDGLKIEPLPPELCGVDAKGGRVPFHPVRDIAEIMEPLGTRAPGGFGGVAEYGITVRWDKNFLKIARLVLERRAAFNMTGGVRFGSNITFDDAFAMGFDHIALAMGAGRPTILPIKNNLARGVRQASDFLMGLQLTGAALPDSIANLEVRLPIAVIGGGLTAIDTATESLAYYVVQVEKFLHRHETLVAEKGKETVETRWSEEEKATAAEFIAHGSAIRAEREAAKREGREARIIQLLNGWGGATVVYRRDMREAPSYTLNHEEIEKGMEEGIRFLDEATPVAVDVDKYGHAEALAITTGPSRSAHKVPAKTIFVAAGTQPNVMLSREFPHQLTVDGRNFVAIDEDGNPVKPELTCKPKNPQVLTAKTADGRFISFFGDLHPSFAGNVVKAMSSAKQGYPAVSKALARRTPTPRKAADIFAELNAGLRPTVHKITRHTPNIVEVMLKAPMAAKHFEPGQFYRLQNYAANAKKNADTTLAMEGLALTGAWVDKEAGLISVIVLEMGGSSSLCAHLKIGEPVVLMGPTGSPTHVPENSAICLVGGGLGNAVLFSIGQAARAKGTKVLYFAGYRNSQDRYRIEDIEKAADRIIWSCDSGNAIVPSREGDKAFVGNIVQSMLAYSEGKLGPIDLPLSDCEKIVVIGSDRMMAAVSAARKDVLKPYVKPDHIAVGSINSPMQCMMKEICAQCLQLHKDPATGEETIVFSCTNQDQELDRVDWHVLHERLGQNTLPEKITAQWIARTLKELS